MASEEYIDVAYDIFDGTDEMMPPFPPVVFVHGVLDTKTNWSDIAEMIADRSVRMVYTIDLPNHGDSPESTVLTINNLIGSIERFLKKIGEPIIIVGHSIGGAMAIDIALREPHLVKKIVLIDSSLISYPLDILHEIRATLKIMRDVPKIIPSGLSLAEARVQVDKYLKTELPKDAVRKVILPTLIQDDSGFKWKTKLDIVENMSVNSTLSYFFPFQGSYKGETLIIHGELSNYVRKEDHDEIRKIVPKVRFQCIKGAGHLIHMEKKQDLINALLTFL